MCTQQLPRSIAVTASWVKVALIAQLSTQRSVLLWSPRMTITAAASFMKADPESLIWDIATMVSLSSTIMNSVLLLLRDDGAVRATLTIASSISFSTGASVNFLTLCLFFITSKKSMFLLF